MITWKLPVYKFALERKEKMKSLPSLTHFLANWMITISDFFPSVFHSFFTSEENVFLLVREILSILLFHHVLSISLSSSMIHNVKLVVPQKTLLLLIKKKQVIDTWFYSLLLFEFLLSWLLYFILPLSHFLALSIEYSLLEMTF